MKSVEGNIYILYKKYDSRENKIVTQRGYVQEILINLNVVILLLNIELINQLHYMINY
jgi:hypothetical protein